MTDHDDARREWGSEEKEKEGARVIRESRLSPAQLVGNLIRARSDHAEALTGNRDTNDDGIRDAIARLKNDVLKGLSQVASMRAELDQERNHSTDIHNDYDNLLAAFNELTNEMKEVAVRTAPRRSDPGMTDSGYYEEALKGSTDPDPRRTLAKRMADEGVIPSDVPESTHCWEDELYRFQTVKSADRLNSAEVVDTEHPFVRRAHILFSAAGLPAHFISLLLHRDAGRCWSHVADALANPPPGLDSAVTSALAAALAVMRTAFDKPDNRDTADG